MKKNYYLVLVTIILLLSFSKVHSMEHGAQTAESSSASGHVLLDTSSYSQIYYSDSSEYEVYTGFHRGSSYYTQCTRLKKNNKVIGFLENDQQECSDSESIPVNESYYELRNLYWKAKKAESNNSQEPPQ